MMESDIRIGDKEYHVKIARTEEEKTTGLSTAKNLPEDEGMLFVYDEPQDELYYTMEDTDIDLDIIFIDEAGEVISVNSVKAHDERPVYEEEAQFVLEVNINSGISEGDELDDFEEYDDSELSDSDKSELANSKLLVLDPNGNVQGELQGGERIFSILNTRSLIKAALRAFHSDSDTDYRRVGSLVFKYLDIQDSNSPEYVQAPD